ncbi:type II toxin-antitoxin system VapC family toxin [Nostoc sp.]|uniref:type II toxin-antitoxin system VapC family toxin n=1 Tax=Nostoc sp. TaxID=1180 RepID=UPI002FF7366A
MNIQWRVVELGRCLRRATPTQQQSTSFTAIALSRKLVLLTRNHWDLGKLPGLLIEDWRV